MEGCCTFLKPSSGPGRAGGGRSRLIYCAVETCVLLTAGPK